MTKEEIQMQEKDGSRQLSKYAILMKTNAAVIFEYDPDADVMRLFDVDYHLTHEIGNYMDYMTSSPRVSPSDRRKLAEYFREMKGGMLEMEATDNHGRKCRKVLNGVPVTDDETGARYLLGMQRDVTAEKERELIYRDRASRDSLTMLYNHSYGKEQITEYLEHKNPYDSCGLMVVDIDYFKSVNDVYGHLFGDKVLIHFSVLLSGCCKSEDVVMRAGGDEFVILFKNITHNALVKRAMDLVEGVQGLRFEENDYTPTCSIGVCYLPENVSGYTYDQLFQNADWALYQAKERGRNRYVFCDNLRRFEENQQDSHSHRPNIDARYFQNDVVATAFEVFEKIGSFEAAMELLLEIIGIRFQLDRISVIRADIREKAASRQYQWTAEGVEEVLQNKGDFAKEDFLTLFHSYDEYGTTVLNYDDMEMYSQSAKELLMQGGAKTVLYAAMYCEGHYVGAISYVVCEAKRYWSRSRKRQISEITRVISANLAKKQVLNTSNSSSIMMQEYDYLTGLLSFSRFREEVERIIIGGYANPCAMIYSDFENFKYYNQKYGYAAGDQLLKEFTSYVISCMEQTENIYFTRVVSDQFLLFTPIATDIADFENSIRERNEEFIRRQSVIRPECRLRIRSGIYQVTDGCESASVAIDAANFARKRVRKYQQDSVVIYNEAMGVKQNQDNEVISCMDEALNKGQFKIYLQPKFALRDNSIIGAEALIRWEREDGNILTPDIFVPLYEANGRITDLDFYVFEQVAAFFARNQTLGRKLYPISVNASILHASDPDTVRKYREILDSYHVDPSLVEIELTETATVLEYDNAKRLFQQLQEMGMHTAMDDFGAGYSVLNMVIDIPVNTVKLDRVFINNCGSSEKGIFFLKQLIGMIKGMGYQVVCEGVETKEQADILKEAGCEFGQGYLISRPVPIEKFEEIVYGTKKEEGTV